MGCEYNLTNCSLKSLFMTSTSPFAYSLLQSLQAWVQYESCTVAKSISYLSHTSDVIIIWVLSSECTYSLPLSAFPTKFGGNAELCLLVSTGSTSLHHSSFHLLLVHLHLHVLHRCGDVIHVLFPIRLHDRQPERSHPAHRTVCMGNLVITSRSQLHNCSDLVQPRHDGRCSLVRHANRS